MDLPVHVDIELTQQCNLKCKHCFVPNKRFSFSKKTFNVIKKLNKQGVIIFELVGGEPLLIKEIFSIIKYLKGHNRIVTISTNGTLITKDIAKKLAKNSPHKIFVSLDGPKKINDFIRGKGSFNKTISGISNLNDMGMVPSTSFCLNKLNLNSINELIKETKNLKIKSLFFIFGEPPKRKNSFSKYFFKHSERVMVADKISKLSIPIKYTMHFAPKKIDVLYYGCFFRLTMCEITPSGDVLSCPIVRRKEGNVLKEDLRIIWKRVQNNLLKKMSKKCRECDWKKRCFPCEFDD